MKLSLLPVVVAALTLISSIVGAQTPPPPAPGIAPDSTWKLEVKEEGTRYESLKWVRGEDRVAAVTPELLEVMNKARNSATPPKLPVLITSEAFAHAAVVLPPSSEDGFGVHGATVLLKPGKSARLPGFRRTPMELALAKGGAYFYYSDGETVYINFLHLPREGATEPEPETITTTALTRLNEKDVQIVLKAEGAHLVDGTSRIPLLPKGRRGEVSVVYADLTKSNIDVIENMGGVDLLRKALEGDLEPSGEKKDLDRLVSTLTAPKHKSAILWGDLGVDAIGVIHKLAYEISQDRIPALKGWKVFEMSWTRFNTDTYVGGTTKKVNALLDAVRQKKVILYFPDIEKLVRLGVDTNSQNQDDASASFVNDLRGDRVVMIGTSLTGSDGIGRLREQGPNFHANFTELQLLEPKGKELFKIIREAANRKEGSKPVHFTDEILKKVIDLTSRHVYRERQPRKSLQALSDLTRRHAPANDDAPIVEINEQQVLQWVADKSGIATLAEKEGDKKGLRYFVRNDVFFRAMGEDLIGCESGKTVIRENLIRTLGTNRQTNVNTGGEMGPPVMLFMGSSGTGKSFAPQVLKKQLAKYGVDWKWLNVEGSQLKGVDGVNYLFGAPPGYAGTKPGDGLLYREIETNPQMIVVFEELDKIGKPVWEAILPFLEYGEATDNATGKKNYLSRGIVIFTANFGSVAQGGQEVVRADGERRPNNTLIDQWDMVHHLHLARPEDFPEVKDWNEDDLKRHLLEALKNEGLLTPPVARRMGGHRNIVIFHHFLRPEVEQIGKNLLASIAKSKRKEFQAKVVFENGLLEHIVELAWGPRGGRTFDEGAGPIIQEVDIVRNAVTEFEVADGLKSRNMRWIVSQAHGGKAYKVQSVAKTKEDLEEDAREMAKENAALGLEKGK